MRPRRAWSSIWQGRARALVWFSQGAINLVPEAPTVTTHPDDRSVPPGASVSFISAATGNPLPSAQWQRNDGAGWTNIGGANIGTYTFTAALEDSGAQFRCTWTNGIIPDGISNAASLTVTPVVPPAPPSGLLPIAVGVTLSGEIVILI